MADETPWTIQRLLTWTAEYFQRQGSESPRLDAEVLLSHVLQCQRIELYSAFDRVPGESQLDQFRALVKRRAAGEPVAYLVERKEFFSLPFVVNPHVLIPRPETELLVVEAMDVAKGMGAGPLKIADVGTGSGVIAIALAKHLPRATLFASDRSPEALEVAQANAQAIGVADRIQFRVGDLLMPLTEGSPFDLVVSNPPYVGQSERDSLPPSVVRFEPAMALFAEGPVGTETIERLIDQAIQFLRPGGVLAFEIGPAIASRVQSLLENCSSLEQSRIKRDWSGKQRLAMARKV